MSMKLTQYNKRKYYQFSIDLVSLLIPIVKREIISLTLKTKILMKLTIKQSN